MAQAPEKRNRWNSVEIGSVAEKAAMALMTRYRAMDLFPSIESVQKKDILVEVKQAQAQVIEPARRKKDFSGPLQKTMERHVRDVLRLMIAQEQKKKSDGGKPELRIVQLANAGPAPEEKPAPDPIATLGEALGKAIAKGFIGALEGSLMSDLLKYVRRNAPKEAPADAGGITGTVSVPEDRERKPRVAIIGLLPEQRQQIMRRFPNLDMRFLDNNPTGDRLETVTASCDSAVLMTKFCSHIAMKKCRAKHYLPVNGGMTDLAHVLRGRYGEPISARNVA